MHKTIASDKYCRLISWLKKSRTDKGLSMRELAIVIGQPHSYIGKIETMERRLDVLEYVRYCEALEISPEEGLGLLKSS